MPAVMISPFYGAGTFIVRVVPIKNLTVEFLYDVVNTVLQVMHSAEGHVFSVMWDNFSVNEKTYKMFHETLIVLRRLCILAKTRSLVYCSHYLIQCFCLKIFETIVVLKKSKLYEFQNPQTNKKHIAKWKDLTKIYMEETEQYSQRNKIGLFWHFIQVTYIKTSYVLLLI